MRMKALVIAVFLFLGQVVPGRVLAGDIKVSAAASLKDAFQEIVAAYLKSTPDVTITTNFGASGALAKQIVQGAPADLLVSADGKWIDYLLQEGKGVAATRQTLASNTLVFAGQRGKSLAALGDLRRLERIAIGSPASVPAGNYAVQAMRAAGIYEDLEKERKLVMAQDVRQALLYADRGEVDGAFVYRTDALLAKHAAILLAVPADLHAPITYPLVLTTGAEERPEVKAFFTYLLGSEAAAVLEKYGFAPAQ